MNRFDQVEVGTNVAITVLGLKTETFSSAYPCSPSELSRAPQDIYTDGVFVTLQPASKRHPISPRVTVDSIHPYKTHFPGGKHLGSGFYSMSELIPTPTSPAQPAPPPSLPTMTYMTVPAPTLADPPDPPLTVSPTVSASRPNSSPTRFIADPGGIFAGNPVSADISSLRT
jgi:hypothetical protein